MKEIIKPNRAYSVTLALLAAIIIFTIYLIGGILYAIPFFFIFVYLFCTEVLKKIYLTDTLLVFQTCVSKKEIKLSKIVKIYFVPHSGRGRDYYHIVYENRGKKKKIKLISYKYDKIYVFIDSLKDFGIKIERKTHKQKKLIHVLFFIYGIIAIFIFYKSMYEFMNYITQALQNEYHTYNYYFLWLILAFVIVVSISYIVYLYKKNYYNLIFYRTIIFIIVSIFIYFNMINIGVDNKNEMYNNLLKCKYQITTYNLENGKYPEDIASFIREKVKFESNLMHGWENVKISVKEVVSLDIAEIKPGMLLLMKYEDRYRIFASFVIDDYLKIIDDNGKTKKLSRKINLYHSR